MTMTEIETDRSMEVSDFFRRAWTYLDQNGWYQGDFTDPYHDETANPPACIVGAMRMLATDKWVYETALTALAQALDPDEARCAQDECDLVEVVAVWNDDPDRLLLDVEHLLLSQAAR